MARIVIPFASGAREDVDPKVMPEGGLKRAENLRMRRDGRLGVRYGYTALALTRQNQTPPATSMVATDVVGFNGRLLALASNPGLDSTPMRDVYEYVNQTGFAWRPTDDENDVRLNLITGLRDVGRPPSQNSSISIADVSAGGGLCCLVWSAASETRVHIFNPTTDATIVTDVIASGFARTVCVGSVFFILLVVSATVALYRYDPATDTGLVQLTDAFATGDAIVRMDATVSEDGNGFIVGLARNTPTITLRLFNSSGTATQSITGPAVAVSRITVFRQSARVHVVVVESSDSHVDLYTYETAGGTLENTTTDLATGATTGRQPGICLTGILDDLLVVFEDGSVRTVYQVEIDPSTHTVVRTRTWDNTSLNSKPAQIPTAEILGCCVADSSSTDTNGLAVVGIAYANAPEMLAAATDKGLAGQAASTAMPHIAKDRSTSKYYWVRFSQDGDGRANPLVTEFLAGDTSRRQTAIIDNQLYIAGGAVQSFAGRQVVEAGFLNRPVILSATPSNGAGAITSGQLYAIAATFEWYDEQGRFHTSEPSDVTEVTMGGSDDTITVSVTTPLSLRCNSTNQVYGGATKVVIWRSLAAPDKQLLRDNASVVSPGNFGQEVSVVLTQSDANLSDEAVIYTQGASGARSGPNAFVSPLPCRYIWPSSDKLLTGGLPQDTQIQESRAAFPNEPITWAANQGGLSAAPERVLGVVRLDERRIALTANGLVEFTGEGLDLNGVGDLGSPRRLPSPGGLYGGFDGWRSLVETHVGIYFQLAADSIFLLPRGGGAPVFVGKPVRDTLASFPTITSATYLKTEQLVCFTCNNLAGNDSVILVHDLDHGQWFVDTDTTALTSSCEYGGRLVILRSSGAIEWQNATHPAAAFISTLVESGTLYPFGQGGQGQIDEIQFYGEFRGNCVLTMSLTFDDGKTYPVSKVFNLATSGQSRNYAVGDTVSLKWGPNTMRGDRVRVKFECAALSGAATEGIVYNYATIDFTAAGRSALRDTNQKG